MHLLTVAYNEAVDIVDTEKLVTAVSHYKYLYNNGHTRYKSKKRVSFAWAENGNIGISLCILSLHLSIQV